MKLLSFLEQFLTIVEVTFGKWAWWQLSIAAVTLCQTLQQNHQQCTNPRHCHYHHNHHYHHGFHHNHQHHKFCHLLLGSQQKNRYFMVRLTIMGSGGGSFNVPDLFVSVPGRFLWFSRLQRFLYSFSSKFQVSSKLVFQGYRLVFIFPCVFSCFLWF